MIVSVVSGGSADIARLSNGDTITAINGAPVTSPESLTDEVLLLSPGSTVDIQYVDPSGQQSSIDVTLRSGPPQ